MKAMICICGYTSAKPTTVRRHQRTCKKFLLDNAMRSSLDDLKQQEAQIKVLEAHLQEKDARIQFMEFQIKELIKRCAEQNEEHKHSNKSNKGKRVYRTEPERRKIAMRQNWFCASKACGKELAEYDIDHINPLSQGGTEDSWNLQALCPACHRKKTDQERVHGLQMPSLNNPCQQDEQEN